MVRNELARIVRLFDSYTERRAPHVVPVSSKVDANAFRQVHAIVTRMHDGGPALLTALRHGSPLSARSRPASTPPRYASYNKLAWMRRLSGRFRPTRTFYRSFASSSAARKKRALS